MSRRRSDLANSAKREDPEVTKIKDTFEQKILAKLGGEEMRDQKAGFIDDLMRSGRLQFLYNGTLRSIRSIRWTLLRNTQVGGIVTLKEDGVRIQPIPFFLNEVDEKFQVSLESISSEVDNGVGVDATNSDPLLGAEQVTDSASPDLEGAVDIDDEKEADAIQSSSQEEIEALKKKIKELNRKVQQGVESRKSQIIENDVISSEERIRKLEQQKNPILVEEVEEDGSKDSPEGEGELVQAQQEQLRELQQKTAEVKARWDEVKQRADETEKVLQGLIKKRDGFFARIKRLFPKATSVSVGRIEYEDVDLGAFKEEIAATQMNYDKLREEARNLEIAWEEAGEDEKDFMERIKKEKIKIEEALENKYLNKLQNTINEQNEQNDDAILADGKDVLDGISKELGWDGKSAEMEVASEENPTPLSDDVEKADTDTGEKGKKEDRKAKKSKGVVPPSDILEDKHSSSLREYLKGVDILEKKRINDAKKEIIQYLEGDAHGTDPKVRWKEFLELAKEKHIRGSAVLKEKGLRLGEEEKRERDAIVLVLLMQAHREKTFDELLGEMVRRIRGRDRREV